MTDGSMRHRPISRPICIQEALSELARVHELEQARLLRVASLLRLRRAPVVRGARGPAIPPPRSRRELRGCTGLEEWRSTAIEELRTARADGVSIDRTLAELARSRIESWPVAVSIAEAAHDLGPGMESALALARARLAGGELEDGLEVLLDLLERDPLEDHRLAALEIVAVGLEFAGDLSGSLAFQEAALNSRGGGLQQAVPLLVLALRVGDEPRTALASERLHGLDLAVPGVRSRFEAALSCVRRSSGPRAVGEGSPGIGLVARIREFLRRNRGPEAEVAKLVLGR